MSVRDALINSARQLGVSPLDLATIVSYETAGTFDPMKAGPTTQWGQHRGLIQWGEPQARKYLNGDFSLPSQSKGIVSYMQDAGVKPGMGLLDMYSAVNAGKVGRYNASDANNGGAPGTVRDKVENQMAGHRAKAEGLIGDTYGNMPDGPKGQEVYSPPAQPVDNTAVASIWGNGASPGGIPQDVASEFQSAYGEGEKNIWERLSGIGKALDDSIPKAPGAGGSYGGQGGNMLAQVMNQPNMGDTLLQRRLAFLKRA